MRTKINFDGKKLYFISLHFIIIVFGVQLFVLAKQNPELKESKDPFWAGRLKIGDFFSVDSLSAVNSSTNHPIRQDERQLIFVFSTRCRFCKANMEIWRNIAEEAKKKRLRVYAISLDSLARTRSYIDEYRVTQYDVFVPLNLVGFAKENRLGGVPLTILRSPPGNVGDFWQGLLGKSEVSEIVRKISS